jgi:hypothetical protein
MLGWFGIKPTAPAPGAGGAGPPAPAPTSFTEALGTSTAAPPPAARRGDDGSSSSSSGGSSNKAFHFDPSGLERAAKAARYAALGARLREPESVSPFLSLTCVPVQGPGRVQERAPGV